MSLELVGGALETRKAKLLLHDVDVSLRRAPVSQADVPVVQSAGFESDSCVSVGQLLLQGRCQGLHTKIARPALDH